MKLEVGEYYLNARGEIIQISNESNNILEDKNFNKYFKSGKYVCGYRSNDLIAHIPKQLHKHILNEINSYYTDKGFKEIVDSVWGK